MNQDLNAQIQQEDGQDTSNHLIFNLEPLVKDLDEQDFQIAQALFLLLREKASLENDLEKQHVHELKRLFRPMQERVDEELARITGVRAIFDQAERDKSPLHALEAVLDDADFDEQKAEHARTLLKLNREHGYNLKAAILDVLAPIKQRCLDDFNLVSEIKAVFENFD